MACELGAVDGVCRDGVRCGGATGVAGVTGCTPRRLVCRAGAGSTHEIDTTAEKPNAPDCSEARDLRSGDLPTMPEAAP